MIQKTIKPFPLLTIMTNYIFLMIRKTHLKSIIIVFLKIHWIQITSCQGLFLLPIKTKQETFRE